MLGPLIVVDRHEIEVVAAAELLEQFAIAYVAPDARTALVAAHARNSLPLSFGDCFAYALAKMTREPLLTLDTDFAKTDIALVKLA